MPRLVQNITNESIQRHVLIYNDIETIIILRFSSQVGAWFIDVNTGDKFAYGVKLAVGVQHIESRNMPCDFTVTDNKTNSIDPFRSDDFSEGRCSLILLDNEDMVEIRGQRVQ